MDTMCRQIKLQLERLEAEQEINILFAVESGSRAWGFASASSDWDVRFVYAHRPEWYLSLEKHSDVIDLMLPDDLDLSGWDLPKALRLFAKSNPPLMEWLRSPIVYCEQSWFVEQLRHLQTQYFAPQTEMYHYLHMASGNFREYLRGDQVRLKKYFYALRPILACRWIEHENSMPPMEFSVLAAQQLPEGLNPFVSNLLARKRAGDELALGPQIPEINLFIDSELERFKTIVASTNKQPAPSFAAFDALFLETLERVWQKQ